MFCWKFYSLSWKNFENRLGFDKVIVKSQHHGITLFESFRVSRLPEGVAGAIGPSHWR